MCQAIGNSLHDMQILTNSSDLILWLNTNRREFEEEKEGKPRFRVFPGVLGCLLGLMQPGQADLLLLL
jgi:hypothetical protein